MLLIGENLNVMVKRIGQAMKDQDPKPIQELAIAEAEAGVDFIDINLGPARKGGEELMEWMVKTVQEVVDTPLYLDTTNIQAIEAGLKVYQPKRGKAVINSIMCRPERMEAQIPVAARYGAGMVALLWGPEGMPRDASERSMFATELLTMAVETGVPPEDIYVDPIITPVNVQQQQLMECIDFMQQLGEIAEILSPGVQSTCGLSNVSNGAPEHLRPILNQTFMIILQKYGMTSAIVDAFDRDLRAIARGERSEMVDLVSRVVDGEDVDMLSLNEEEKSYVKTARVLLGRSLYSDSWLELE
jgi:5-methyltetrahydrofolate corrinoid/iron sulfur protein methyltransferase